MVSAKNEKKKKNLTFIVGNVLCKKESVVGV
jgi:hypothetical protein